MDKFLVVNSRVIHQSSMLDLVITLKLQWLAMLFKRISKKPFN